MTRENLLDSIRGVAQKYDEVQDITGTERQQKAQGTKGTEWHHKLLLVEQADGVGTDTSQLVEVTVVLLSGVLILEQISMPLSKSVLDLKLEIERQEGTPVVRQQLIYDGNDVPLADISTLAELGSDGQVTLNLCRRESLRFLWDLSPHFACGSPECLVKDFEVGPNDQAVSIRYYPKGDRENAIVKQGQCSVFVTGPPSSIMHCRIGFNDQTCTKKCISAFGTIQSSRECTIAGFSRTKLFTAAFGQSGWPNFCQKPEVQPTELIFEVTHLGIVDQPLVEGESASWDLRSALGGMAFAKGQQFKSKNIVLGEAHVQLVFFPGGYRTAPEYHTSLWVMPIEGLFDRKYLCTVDGVAQGGTGESQFHFPRPEVFGNVHIKLL